MPIQNIFFDADETLYRLKYSVGEIYSSVINRHGFNTNPQQFDCILAQVWQTFEPFYLNKEQNFRINKAQERENWLSFVQMMLDAAGVEGINPKVHMEIYDEFRDPKLRVIEPKVEDVFLTLNSAGFKLHVLSNHDERIKDIILKLPISRFIESVTSAVDLGWKKPSKQFFLEAVRSKSLLNSDCLYVGNNYELDYKAAKNAGWNAVLYNPQKRIYNVEDDEQMGGFKELLEKPILLK